MNLVELIEKEQVTKEPAKFNVGDTVKVFFKIVEGNKERIQAFEGLVIARKNGGIRETFTVRKISFGIGVERTFPVHSPRIDRIEVVREGKVRRAKLYYIRDLTGKAAVRVKEKKGTKPVKVAKTAKTTGGAVENKEPKVTKAPAKAKTTPSKVDAPAPIAEASETKE